MIRVLICDDHLIVRQGIKQVLAEARTCASSAKRPTGPMPSSWCVVVVSTSCCWTSPCPSATGWTS